MSGCQLILSGFADEAAFDKTIDQQFAALAAVGLEYLTIRFIDAGNGIRNAVDLDSSELDAVLQQLDAYGLQISSLGSPIGKVKLLDENDGTRNVFVPFDQYLDQQVVNACRVANRLQTRLVRGFSFYHPRGKDPHQYVSAAARRIAKICSVCEEHSLIFGLEVEANLVGQNASTLMAIYEQVASESLVLIFDGGNLVTQGFSTAEILQQFREMLPALGWIHIKDYRATGSHRHQGGYVDEDALQHFVPAGEGDSGYPEILQALNSGFVPLQARLDALGLPGLFADLEPHLKAGGQFGGFSGPDGFGIATRSFCAICDAAGVTYRLRDSESISQARRS